MNKLSKKQDLSHFPISRIKQAPENESIYDNFGVANADDRQLIESINNNGIHEPLVITSDWVLLSGHRRLAAATYLGLSEVPVRIRDDVIFADLDKQERVKLLRVHNQQREKSASEKIREAIKPPVFKEGPQNGVWVWKNPEQGRKYVMSSDVARGDSSDFSTFHIIDYETCEVVAEFMGKIPPDRLAEILSQYGKRFNSALICPEQNTFGYFTCVKFLIKIFFPLKDK
jgi:hypothetical protein